MTVSIERIRELRNRYSTGNSLMSHAPQEVWRTSKDLVSIMNELLEYREAEEQSECERTEDIYDQPVQRIPLEGTVS